MSDLKVGDKIVCVNLGSKIAQFPFIDGAVYTVAELSLSPLGNPLVRTEEEEGQWYSHRFQLHQTDEGDAA